MTVSLCRKLHNLCQEEALLDMSKDWQKEGLPELKMRIGIAKGPVVVGNFGNRKRSDYSVIGPSVNFAARIESVCIPGEVYFSADVGDHLNDEQFVEAGQYELKGIDGITRLYKLL